MLNIIEHFFYCDLYKDPQYKGLEFNDKFLSKNEFIKKGEHSELFRKGTHIIELIKDNSYMSNALNKINSIISLFSEFVDSTSPSKLIKDKFAYYNTANNKKENIDDAELNVIYNFISKILKDKKIIPKALIMKYFLSLKDMKENSKKDIRKIYGVYLLAVFFTIFENKKSKDILFSILKSDDISWYKELILQVSSYFQPDKITDARLLAQYRMAQNEEIEDYRFRCKSLATIYNFFQINNDTIVIKKGEMNNLLKFTTSSADFTTEHLIISQDTNTKVYFNNQELSYKYSDSFYNRYVNNLFNFIFIPQDLNKKLENYWLPQKLEIVNSMTLNCQYSKMYIKNIVKISTEMQQTISDTEQPEAMLDSFFAKKFKDLYIEFARKILEEVITKIKPGENK